MVLGEVFQAEYEGSIPFTRSNPQCRPRLCLARLNGGGQLAAREPLCVTLALTKSPTDKIKFIRSPERNASSTLTVPAGTGPAAPGLIQVNVPRARSSIHCSQLREEYDMSDKPIDWTPDLSLPTSKSTVQHFIAKAGGDRLEIETMPWGEADLMVNGQSIAHIETASSAGDAFRALETIAEDFEAGKDAPLDQAIEDDEVRERLGLTRLFGGRGHRDR